MNRHEEKAWINVLATVELIAVSMNVDGMRRRVSRREEEAIYQLFITLVKVPAK